MNGSVIEWLLQSDPSVRWQVMQDLTDASERDTDAVRALVAYKGWGAELLALQSEDGGWGRTPAHSWVESPDGSTTYSLSLLRYMGADPHSEPVAAAVERVRQDVTYIWQDDIPYLGGETEVCVNGMVLTVGSYFAASDDRLQGVVDRLLSEQLDDGGWNCDAPDSVRGSFHSTICVLEGLLEWERRRPDPSVADARRRGQEYLLERGLLRRRSSGEIINPAFLRFGFPPGWHYDVLRGLDYLRDAGVHPDERIAEAVELVAARQQPDGRWPLDSFHPGLDEDNDRTYWESLEFGPHEQVGNPSYWNTLRALRVLRWASKAA